MDALGVDRAVLVGLSRGGWRAILAAIEFPDRVAGVVSLASTVPHLRHRYRRVRRYRTR